MIANAVSLECEHSERSRLTWQYVYLIFQALLSHKLL